MAARTHTHTHTQAQTQQSPDLSSNCVPHLWMGAETRDGAPELPAPFSKSEQKSRLTLPTRVTVSVEHKRVKHGVSTLAGA